MYDNYDPDMELMEDLDEDFGSYQEGSFEDFDDFGDGEFEVDDYGLFEDDGFGEFEDEDDFGEFEDGDEFFGKIWKGIKKVAKKVAPIAKRFAPVIGKVIGGALGGPAGAAIGGKLGGFVKSWEGEDEYESEDEMEAEYEGSGLDEGLAEAMATAGSKGNISTAQSMGSALTVTIASRAPIEVKKVLPVLSKASGDVAKVMAKSGDKRAKYLIRTLPTIQKKTVATLTAKAKKGKPITPKTAARVMTKHAVRTLNSPTAVAKALANNAVKKRKLDKAAIAKAERFY